MTVNAQGNTEGQLQGRKLGVVAISFFVIAAAGPLVAMAGGVPVAMLFGNGAGAPALFVGLTIILLLFSAGYTEMAKHVINAGAFYAYAREGLGYRSGGAMGLVALVSYGGMQAGLFGLFGAAAAGLSGNLFGVSPPWWVPALVAMVAIAWFGYRQIDLSLKLLGTLCALEYLVVLVLDVAVLFHGGKEGLSLEPFQTKHVLSGSPVIGLVLSFGAFIGFEATTIYAEEARDPDRSIPRATYLALMLIGVFYALSTWAVVIGLGPSQATQIIRQSPDPTQILFQLAGAYVGPPLVMAMQLLFVSSIFAALLAFHNALARYLFALGRDNLLPQSLARSHPLHGSPYVGSLAQSAVSLLAICLFALASADPVLTVFTLPTALGTLGVMILMTITALAVIVFLARVGGTSQWRLMATAVSLVALGVIAVLATTRFDVLTGGVSGVSRFLPAILIPTAFLGALLAKPASGSPG